MTTQRYIRVLVYEGSPESLADVKAKRGVKGSYSYRGVDGTAVRIREAEVGDFLETLIPLGDDNG